MSDRRGQASTIVVGAIVLSVVLSIIVGGGLSLGGTTNDLNLNEGTNNGIPDVPAISYVAVCFAGDVPPEGFSTDNVDITFSDEGESGEFFSASFTTSGLDAFDPALDPTHVIIKGGQYMEQFDINGPYTFGDGTLVDPANPNNAPCGEGFFGVKTEVEGDEEVVFVKENGPSDPIGPVLPLFIP